MMKVKLLHPLAKAPERARQSDAGFDLFVTEERSDEDAQVVSFGVAVEIPHGYVGLLLPRSSVVSRGMFLANSVGVIDAGYRGEIKAVFLFSSDTPQTYDVGERAAQLVVVPILATDVKLVDELSPSPRGTGGFGSTGRA